MKADDIERLLANEPQIGPSAGFAVNVMAAVQRVADAPEPARFPWLRALPAFAATGLALGAASWQGIGALLEEGAITGLGEQFARLGMTAPGTELIWAAVAIAVAFASAALPISLMRARTFASSPVR